MSRRLLMAAAGGSGAFTFPTGVMTLGAISTVTDNSKYNAWPVVCRASGTLLVLGYTVADSHHQDNTGKAVCRVSSNEGASWGSEITVYDHASLWASVYGLMQTSSGRILATLWRDNYAVAGTGEAGLVYSDDDGATWSSWVALTNGFTQEAYGAGPAVELSNGDLLITIEGSNSGQSIADRSSHTLRSSNDGATWGGETTVRNFVTDTRPYYESKLLATIGSLLLCIHRTTGDVGSPHYVSRSTDEGSTWSAPTVEFAGYGAPSSIRTSRGVIVSTTRRDADAGAVAFSSIDSGDSWANELVIDNTMYQSEYACPVELLDGRVLVVYGSQPTSSITNADIKQAYVTVA